MKQKLMIFIAALVFIFTGCTNTNSHIGQVKPPTSSYAAKGKIYTEIVEDFEENGFTNITLVTIDDLITGWLTKDGEVESVSIDGDSDYSTSAWYSTDAEIVITYHTFPSKTEENTKEATEEGSEEPTEQDSQSDIIATESDAEESSANDNSTEPLTIENCSELANIFSLKGEICPEYKNFAENHSGELIEFDASIDYITNHEYYNSLNGSSKISDYDYDILISYGDYNADSNLGPTMKFEGISSRQLGYDVSSALPSFMYIGANVTVRAYVGSFNEDTGIFTLHYDSIVERN